MQLSRETKRFPSLFYSYEQRIIHDWVGIYDKLVDRLILANYGNGNWKEIGGDKRFFDDIVWIVLLLVIDN